MFFFLCMNCVGLFLKPYISHTSYFWLKPLKSKHSSIRYNHLIRKYVAILRSIVTLNISYEDFWWRKILRAMNNKMLMNSLCRFLIGSTRKKGKQKAQIKVILMPLYGRNLYYVFKVFHVAGKTSSLSK
ncbi:hypothetical protein Hanom_Chr03g00195961 [Helianthus anomalus]